MKPTIIMTREKGVWIAQATVPEDDENFSCEGHDVDPQVAVYRALHSLFSEIANHYKPKFQVKVTL
jgi:hypothetical protein